MKGAGNGQMVNQPFILIGKATNLMTGMEWKIVLKYDGLEHGMISYVRLRRSLFVKHITVSIYDCLWINGRLRSRNMDTTCMLEVR